MKTQSNLSFDLHLSHLDKVFGVATAGSSGGTVFTTPTPSKHDKKLKFTMKQSGMQHQDKEFNSIEWNNKMNYLSVMFH